MVFYNQAKLIYRGSTITSNVAVGEIIPTLTLSKSASSDTYSPGAQVEYTITIENSAADTYAGLSLLDDLGKYLFMGSPRFPLSYIPQSATLFYYNSAGVISGTVTEAQDTNGINFTFDLPGSTVALLRYRVQITPFASPTIGSVITNTAVLSGSAPSLPLSTVHSLLCAQQVDLVIAKNASEPAVIGQPLTFTFIVLNYGNVAVTSNDFTILSDSFDPPLAGITVTANGIPWTQGVEYEYDENFYYFRTESGAITLSAAAFTQDSFGRWITSPAALVITVTGTVTSA